MRTSRDRIRHAISFEIIGLLLMIPLGSFVFGLSIDKSGPMAIAFSLLATLWNYVYNIGFDKLMLRLRNTVEKRVQDRVIHAFGFEFGLLFVTLPALAWWLQVTLWQALVMDLFYVVFFLVYAFLFNWGYDKIFPITRPANTRVVLAPGPEQSQKPC